MRREKKIMKISHITSPSTQLSQVNSVYLRDPLLPINSPLLFATSLAHIFVIERKSRSYSDELFSARHNLIIYLDMHMLAHSCWCWPVGRTFVKNCRALINTIGIYKWCKFFYIFNKVHIHTYRRWHIESCSRMVRRLLNTHFEICSCHNMYAIIYVWIKMTHDICIVS